MNELADASYPADEILLSRQHVYATLTALADDFATVYADDVPSLRRITMVMEHVARRFSLQLRSQHDRAQFAADLARYPESQG